MQNAIRESGVIALTHTCMARHETSVSVQLRACVLLRNFTLDNAHNQVQHTITPHPFFSSERKMLMLMLMLMCVLVGPLFRSVCGITVV